MVRTEGGSNYDDVIASIRSSGFVRGFSLFSVTTGNREIFLLNRIHCSFQFEFATCGRAFDMQSAYAVEAVQQMSFAEGGYLVK